MATRYVASEGYVSVFGSDSDLAMAMVVLVDQNVVLVDLNDALFDQNRQ